MPRLADWATVMVIGTEGTGDQMAWAHRDPARLADVDSYLAGRRRGARDMPKLSGALVSGEPMQLPDLDEIVLPDDLPSETVREAWERLNPTSCLFVPLRPRRDASARCRWSQATAVPCTPRPRSRSPSRWPAAARWRLDNARLYGRQLQVAEVLQRSLLFAPAAVEDLQIAVRYRPAGDTRWSAATSTTSSSSPTARRCCVIGDVVGHNVDAAAAMGRLASAVRALATIVPAARRRR